MDIAWNVIFVILLGLYFYIQEKRIQRLEEYRAALSKGLSACFEMCTATNKLIHAWAERAKTMHHCDGPLVTRLSEQFKDHKEGA